MCYNDPMAQIIIHGGSHEIGGSCVEISSGKDKPIIDSGMNGLIKDNQYDI